MGDILDADAVGEVGAAACFSGDTLIASADGNRHIEIRNFIGKIIPIWSFNIKTNLFEIKNATGIKSGVKSLYKLTLSDGGSVVCTEDHKFLTRPKKEYVENKNLKLNDSIYPFKRKIIKNGYWEVRKSKHRKEHIELFKFYNPNYNTLSGDIHHIDFNKRNNRISNLQWLSKKEHTKLHSPSWDNPIILEIRISKEDILSQISKFDDKSEMANYFGLHTDELMYHLGYYDIDKKFKKINSDEQRKLISDRQIGNKNCYHKMPDDWKFKFASHPKEKNPKWSGYSDEDLFKIGHQLYITNGKLTSTIWKEYAKNNNIPQCLSSRFPKWTEFIDECKNYNHTIIAREYLGEYETYTLQVEENNNYVVLSRITKNIEEGIVVKNCGDIMKISLKIDKETNTITDAKFKTFGCGSAIAASSMATELVKGRTVDDVLNNFSNEEVMDGLGGSDEWKTNYPQKIHCSVLATECLNEALTDYKKRNNIK
jgi:nitrogen fixation NifU-like protein